MSTKTIYLPKFEEILRLRDIEYTVKGGRLQLRCPFHDDKNPSAAIYFNTELFHCWTCELTLGYEGFREKLKGEGQDPVMKYRDESKKHVTSRDVRVSLERKRSESREMSRLKGLLGKVEYRVFLKEVSLSIGIVWGGDES